MFGLLFIFAFFSNQAHAQLPCPTVILDRDQGSASGIPIWDQKNASACYSYSASFLASVWIREEWSKTNPTFRNFIDDPKQSFKEIERSPEYHQILDADLGRTCQATQFILKSKRNRTGDPTNPFFATPRCEMWGFTQEKRAGPQKLQDPAAFEDKMHALLENETRPLPFAIEYCSGTSLVPNRDFIINRTFRPSLSYVNDAQASLENLDRNCGFHAAVVTGQALRNGTCYFRVRNSVGEFNARNIENGYFWIPASDLAKNTLRVITLQHE